MQFTKSLPYALTGVPPGLQSTVPISIPGHTLARALWRQSQTATTFRALRLFRIYLRFGAVFILHCAPRRMATLARAELQLRPLIAHYAGNAYQKS